MKIYSDYDQEPEDQFEPLSPGFYTEMYELEMGSFDTDLCYYRDFLTAKSSILEIGCGTGRLSRLLAEEGHQVTGIDLSEAMLASAEKKGGDNIHYINMDMRDLQLSEKFDAVIIPYHTLNLLTDEQDILRTLTGCHSHLRTDGQLLLQLYIPSAVTADDGNASFQFQMFDRPAGGKIVKEIIKKFSPETGVLEMTERYKIRPMQAGQPNTNFSHTMRLHSAPQEQWMRYIEAAGFDILSSTNRYSPSATPSPNMLLLHCRKTE